MQALVVVGGVNWPESLSVFSSVLIFLPGAPAWTQLSPLPRALNLPQASIVGGRLRVNGGGVSLDTWFGNYRSEVIDEMIVQIFCVKYDLLLPRCLNTIPNHGTCGWKSDILRQRDEIMPLFLLGVRSCHV